MKVIGINSSPRKKANTQTLVEAVLAGAAKNGAQTRMVNLRELKINGCLGCEGCKKHLGKCVQNDDLTTLLQELTEYDAIVLGTPVYWFQVSAQFKMLVDRLYSFMQHTDPETGEAVMRFEFPAGKKFILVVSSGAHEPDGVLPQLTDHFHQSQNIIPLSLVAASIESLHQHGAQKAVGQS